MFIAHYEFSYSDEVSEPFLLNCLSEPNNYLSKSSKVTVLFSLVGKFEMKRIQIKEAACTCFETN